MSISTKRRLVKQLRDFLRFEPLSDAEFHALERLCNKLELELDTAAQLEREQKNYR